jgi:hypothetical protein
MNRIEFCRNFDSKIYHKKPLIARDSPKESKIAGDFQKELRKNPLKIPLRIVIMFFIT